jgi:hypothetical protein
MRLRAAFDVEIPVRAVFEAPTIAQLAQIIDSSAPHSGVPSGAGLSIPLTRSPRTGPIPLSSGQQRLWFHDRLYPGSTTYNTQEAVRLVGKLDLTAVGRANNEIRRRHEILRTVFAEVDGGPVQIIQPYEPIETPFVDLRHERGPRQDDAAQRIIVGELARPFDLERGPLLRPLVLQLSDSAHVLIVTAHHLVTDGWTDSIYVSEFLALYHAYARNEPPALDEPRLHYADFAMWEQERLRSGALQSQLAYWKDQLRGDLPIAALPQDHVEAAATGGGSHSFVLATELTAPLKMLQQRDNTTLFMMLAAAWQMLLRYYMKQDDILVGTPHANRERPEVAGIPGFFVNTLVIRGDLTGNPTLAEVLRRTRDTALAAYAHHELPFDKLVEELRADGRDLPTPLFRVWFVLHNVPRIDFELDGLVASQVETHHLTDVHDLKLTVIERPTGLDCEIQFRRRLFLPSTITRMAALFELVVRSMVTSSDLDLASLTSMLGDEERRLKAVEEQEERAQLHSRLKSVRRQITRIAPPE